MSRPDPHVPTLAPGEVVVHPERLASKAPSPKAVLASLLATVLAASGALLVPVIMNLIATGTLDRTSLGTAVGAGLTAGIGALVGAYLPKPAPVVVDTNVLSTDQADALDALTNDIGPRSTTPDDPDAHRPARELGDPDDEQNPAMRAVVEGREPSVSRDEPGIGTVAKAYDDRTDEDEAFEDMQRRTQVGIPGQPTAGGAVSAWDDPLRREQDRTRDEMRRRDQQP